MLLEIRKYTIKPGRRDEFVEFFDSEVLPAMQAHGLDVVGQFVSVDDEDTFWYLRRFADEADRQRKTAAFYESPVWLQVLRERALTLEAGYEVDTVVPAAGSRGQTMTFTQSPTPE